MRRLALLLLLAACEPPTVFPGADARQNSTTARLEGNVIVSSTARGKVVLFLYDANRPPPPTGTGRPLAFTVLSRDDVFGSANDGDAGPFTAPFAFSLVKPGRYLVRGFIDADDDFIPWYGATADTTQGDVGGAAIDPVTRAPRIIEVATDAQGRPVPALEVPVSFSDSARLPLDRPVFSVAGGATSVVLSGAPKVIELQATPIDDGVVSQPSPGFLVRFVDDDNDGVPDDVNRDGIPEVWPRVVVRKVQDAATPLTDENDLDRNGLVDETGADYEKTGVGFDGTPDVVVLAAGFDVSEYAMQLVDSMGRAKTTPIVVPKLKLVLQPRAFDASGAPLLAPLTLPPPGFYAITVIQQTGQTWRVPNELGLGVPGLPAIDSQGFLVQVQ